MKRALSLYLYGRKNVVGCLLALGGLGLFFTGVVDDLWPVVVGGLYALGALVVPGPKPLDMRAGFDPNDVRKSLGRQLRAIENRVPDDVFAKVQQVQSDILEILPKTGRLAPNSTELFVVERTANDYLPSALESYTQLPRAFATRHRTHDGRTPHRALLDQLDLLHDKLSDIADAVNRQDVDRLMANGRFLDDRFGAKALSIDETPDAK